MKVVTWVPWRTDHGPRARLYKAVAPCIRDHGFDVVEADSGHDPFSIGNTFNRCAELSGEWDVALLHDADLYVAPAQVHAALKLVEQGEKGIVFPRNRHVKLNERGTNKFLGGKRSGFHRSEYHIARSQVGGPRFVTRELWETVGGFDPRFVGWGYEDNHFLQQADEVAPHRSVPGDLLNLWHPKGDELPDDPYWKSRERNRKLWESLRTKEV